MYEGEATARQGPRADEGRSAAADVASARHGGLEFRASLEWEGFSLDASFDVAPGETMALVGPSGAGKSTCLELVAGLVSPDRARIALEGAVLVDTERGVDLPPDRRQVGLVYQDHALFPHLTVRRNVAYGPRMRGKDRRATAAVVERWLDRLGLTAWADEPVSRLSGGQRQRAALARALASGARILLLDEPFAALDVTTRAAVRGELRRFLAEVALPTVVVTHDPVDAMVFGDRIAVMELGRITQIGPRDDLAMHPRSPFVADLTGLNLYRADVPAGHGLKEAAVGGIAFHVLADGHAGPVYLAFSPSEVALSSERLGGSPQNGFAGIIREIVPLPDRMRAVLDVGVTMSADVTREAARSLQLAEGRRVWASVKATAIRVYE